MNAIEIFKRTPKINCRKCGYVTCRVFTIGVVCDDVDINTCPYISNDPVVSEEPEAAHDNISDVRKNEEAAPAMDATSETHIEETIQAKHLHEKLLNTMRKLIDDGDEKEENILDPMYVIASKTRHISNKKVRIGTRISVHETLIFEKCKIYLQHLSKRARIELHQNAQVHFRDCEIHCPEYNGSGGSLISSDGGNTSNIIFENCIIHLESSFIFTTGTVQMKTCKLLNGKANTIRAEKVMIDDSLIQFDEAIPFGKGKNLLGRYGDIFTFYKGTINNTRIISTEITPPFVCTNSGRTLKSDGSGIFSKSFDRLGFNNCTIVNIQDNLTNDTRGVKGYVFEACQFINCGTNLKRYGFLRNCQSD